MAVHPESILWILLAFYVLLLHPSVSSFSVFFGALLAVTIRSPLMARDDDLWRSAANDQDCCMDVVLIPVLLQSMALYNSAWNVYATLASFLWILPETTSVSSIWMRSSVVSIGVVLAVSPASESWQRRTEALLTILIWTVLRKCISYYPCFHQVFTRSEWSLVVSLLTIALSEWISILASFMPTPPQHVIVALSGIIGCGIACCIATRIQHVWIRAAILIVLPLVTVEGALWWLCWQDHNDVTFPRAITWLWNFLLATEQSSIPISAILQSAPPLWPRYVWLFYWAVILVLAFVFAPQQQHSSVVVMRKWFHLIAILLFLPVTIVAPQFMSLSFAIATSVLIVLENTRSFLPNTIQDFYLRFLDPSKDHEEDSLIVVSHVALIVGCAMPLWIYECIITTMTTESELDTGITMLLPLFGILVLGVGDSLGALVGSRYGQTKWPFANTSRTLEGSAAMWMGMALCCWLLGIPLRRWFPTVTFTTLLEAVTTQIDNLVLPLAGAAILLLTSSSSS